ncbi:MAG: FecR domain-containing protein, partial [Rhodothermaceae bacterium]|nr:FecR domain-containing protein [Rhodothermaceae bacterium]
PPEVNEALNQEPEQLGDELRRVWDLTGTALVGSTSPSQEVDEMWANIQANTLTSLPPEVNEALNQEPEQLGDELRRVWDLTGTALVGNISPPQEVDDMWASIQAKALQDNTRSSSRELKRELRKDRAPTSRSSRSRVPAFKRLVPAFCVLLLIAFGAYWYTPVTITADHGELAEAQLPDGSIVYLNSGSSVTFKRGFDGNPFTNASERNVLLKGEGFFEVTHSDTPFNVETFNANVRVLGTEFNVRAWPLEPEQESTISLVSGRVGVSKADATSNQIILEEPGHTVVVRKTDALPAAPLMQNIDSAINWRERGLSIKSKTLVAVFDELERRYDIKISVEDTQILNDSLTLLMPKPENLESILSDICIEKNLKYRKTSRGYVIYRLES